MILLPARAAVCTDGGAGVARQGGSGAAYCRCAGTALQQVRSGVVRAGRCGLAGRMIAERVAPERSIRACAGRWRRSSQEPFATGLASFRAVRRAADRRWHATASACQAHFFADSSDRRAARRQTDRLEDHSHAALDVAETVERHRARHVAGDATIMRVRLVRGLVAAMPCVGQLVVFALAHPASGDRQAAQDADALA